MLPGEKQNVVYTNRRAKEMQGLLEKILKAPEEIKVNKDKEQEVEASIRKQPAAEKKTSTAAVSVLDTEAVELSKKYNSFNGKTPAFILVKGIVAENEDK